MAKLSGTVYRYGSRERIPDVWVKATKEGQVQHAVSDDDGDFRFSNLKPGSWTITALHEKSFPSQPKKVDLVDDLAGMHIELFHLSGSVDQTKGRNFFIALLAALGVLIALHIALHMMFPPTRAPLSLTVAAVIEQAHVQAQEAEKTSESAGLLEAIEDLKSGVAEVLANTDDLNDVDKALLTALPDQIEAAAKADNKDELNTRLTALRAVVEEPASPRFALWDQYPWRFLEILLWALGGILVNKIINTGSYLRWKKFYQEGIVMHVSHIVTTPLLVLVSVVLLSLVTLKVTLAGGNEVSLDLSDPRIMAAFSFLIATSPWPLWEFVQETAGKITSQAE